MCQEDLSQVLRHLPKFNDPNLIFGYDTVGDAGVYRISDDIAIVQTVDILTPIADDAYTFGEIAAANSLSDLYVMGARPITALNIIGFPEKLDLVHLEKIAQGGGQKILEAGAVILGGHTIKDDDLKYGLAVTGIVHPDKLITNEGARPGDVLILTKPIGTGIISTALKTGKASDIAVEEINTSMKTLNKDAAELMLDFQVHACTDVTGFGFLGHAAQMSDASKVSFEIFSDRIPLFSEVLTYAKLGFYPGGTKKNAAFVKPDVHFEESISDEMRMILSDAQTSGGLLIVVAEHQANALLLSLHQKGINHSKIVGRVLQRKEKTLFVK